MIGGPWCRWNSSRMTSMVEPISSARHADVVDPRHQLDAEHVDRRRDRDQDRPEQQRVLRPALGQVRAGVGRGAEELELGRDLGQDDLPVDRNGGDRDDRADDVDPAGHPRREAARDLLGPLIHGPGDRVLAGHLHEAQRDQDLTEDHDRPRPPHARAGVEVAEAVQRGDAGQDRDVAEAGRERGEAPQRAVEFLLVSEARELGTVRSPARLWSFYGCHQSTSPVRAQRSRGPSNTSASPASGSF